MRLNLRNQLLLGFAATLLLTLVVSAVGISQASALNDRAALMYDQNQVSTSAIADLDLKTMQDRAAELLGIVIGRFLALRIAGNLGVVESAARGLAANDLIQRAVVHTGDEIEHLADSFNTMAAKLQERVDAERQLKDSLQAAVRDY